MLLQLTTTIKSVLDPDLTTAGILMPRDPAQAWSDGEHSPEPEADPPMPLKLESVVGRDGSPGVPPASLSLIPRCSKIHSDTWRHQPPRVSFMKATARPRMHPLLKQDRDNGAVGSRVRISASHILAQRRIRVRVSGGAHFLLSLVRVIQFVGVVSGDRFKSASSPSVLITPAFLLPLCVVSDSLGR